MWEAISYAWGLVGSVETVGRRQNTGCFTCKTAASKKTVTVVDMVVGVIGARSKIRSLRELPETALF